MRAAPLLFLLLSPLAACSRDCPLVDCLDGANVLVTGAAVTFTDDLPVTLQVCVGSACSSFRLDHTGAAPVCTALTGGTTICTIDEMGTVVLTALPFPAGTVAGAAVAIHATVTEGTGTLFDSTQTVPVSASSSDPGCTSGCDSAEASFTPP
jgi:hypothetical protein